MSIRVQCANLTTEPALENQVSSLGEYVVTQVEPTTTKANLEQPNGQPFARNAILDVQKMRLHRPLEVQRSRRHKHIPFSSVRHEQSPKSSEFIGEMLMCCLIHHLSSHLLCEFLFTKINIKVKWVEYCARRTHGISITPIQRRLGPEPINSTQLEC